MKLSEVTKTVAETCDLKAKVVSRVQEETFRQIQAAIQRGERVQVPEFGVFVGRDSETADGQKTLRFRPVVSPDSGGKTSTDERLARRTRTEASRGSGRGKGRQRAQAAADDGWGNDESVEAAETEAGTD